MDSLLVQTSSQHLSVILSAGYFAMYTVALLHNCAVYDYCTLIIIIIIINTPVFSLP